METGKRCVVIAERRHKKIVAQAGAKGGGTRPLQEFIRKEGGLLDPAVESAEEKREGKGACFPNGPGGRACGLNVWGEEGPRPSEGKNVTQVPPGSEGEREGIEKKERNTLLIIGVRAVSVEKHEK